MSDTPTKPEPNAPWALNPEPWTLSRLRKHADYQRAYAAAGRKQWGKQMAWFAAARAADTRSETPGPRIGLTVPKALGGAVIRNRIKRRMREVVRAALPHLTAPADVILHPKRSAQTCDLNELKREVVTIFAAVQKRYGGASR